MSDLVNRVMKAAAAELLRHEANQIDQEMELLLTEMSLDPLAEGRLQDFWLRFFALLNRRSEVARRAFRVHEADFRALFDLSAGLDATNHHNQHRRAAPVVWRPDEKPVSPARLMKSACGGT